MRLGLPLAIALCATTARAQSTIYGMDVRTGMFFTSDTGAFVANKVDIGANPDPIFALDFDATATTLHGINNTTFEYGTFDLTTGAFTAAGVVAGITGATGLTASPDGATWYLMEYRTASAASFLWSGDVTTGTFALIGQTAAGIMIDISMNCDGALYGHNISDDSLYSIDPTNGLGALIGPTGLLANFAQGMDFDWSDGTLYATIYTGGGTGQFCSMNLATGTATIIEPTTPTNGEFEIAIQQVCSGAPSTGTPICFGDGTGTPCPCLNNGAPGTGCANGTGSGGMLSAAGNADVTNDSMSLIADGVINNNGLFFQGNNTIGGGAGTVFGDGIRCCGGSVVRIQVVNPPGTTSPATAHMTETATTNGPNGTIQPGDKKCYQYWYRDPATSPCGAQFNLTNAVTVIWALGGGTTPGPRCDNCHAVAGTVEECLHFAGDPTGADCDSTQCIVNVMNTSSCDFHADATGAANCNTAADTGPKIVQTLRMPATALTNCPATVNWTNWELSRTRYGCTTECLAKPGVVWRTACVIPNGTCVGNIVLTADRGAKKKCGC